jgi:pilus assembly protein CpaB
MRTFLIVFLLAAVGGIGYLVLSSSQSPAPAATGQPVQRQVSYLIAARPLPAGTLVRDSDIGVRTTPPEQVPARAIVDSAEARSGLLGALVPHYVDVNTPITLDDVLRPRDRGFLASVLTPGLRAVSIGVDAISGVAGLISPGDPVDVLLTQEADPSVPPSKRIMSTTVLRDVRVIAVDQQIVQGASATNAPEGHVARTVTLEVTPEQAQLVAVAERLGTLSLAIRPLSDNTTEVRLSQPVYGSDVAPLPRVLTPPAATVQVIQGDQRTEVRFR